MTKYENGVIRYQIQYEKYKNGIANEIIRLLDSADGKIARYIRKTDGVYTKARYQQIATKLREISRELKNSVEENIDVEGVIDYVLRREKKLMGLIPDITFVYPTTEQIITSAIFRPAADITYDSYLNGIEAGLFNTWDAEVRTGYLTGMSTKQIVNNVMGGLSPETRLKEAGKINKLKNSIYGNTRTLLQSFAEETREEVYRKNEKYFGDGEYKYEWLSTLDSRTCIVCGELDNRLFKTIEDAQPIPRHRNCRCVLLPFFDIEGDRRASKNGYVDADTSFSAWLDDQDETTQKEVLGATRFKMYQEGVKITQFVDNGRVLTLDELEDLL